MAYAMLQDGESEGEEVMHSRLRDLIVVASFIAGIVICQGLIQSIK